MRRIIRLEQAWANIFSASVKFVLYKDGHKTHNSSGQTNQFSASSKTHLSRYFVQTHNSSCARLYTRRI